MEGGTVQLGAAMRYLNLDWWRYLTNIKYPPDVLAEVLAFWAQGLFQVGTASGSLL